MSRKSRTQEEIRRYDIFKGIVAALIAIALLISLISGQGDNTGAAGAPTAESAAAGGEIAGVPAEGEATAPELVDPAPGSEVDAGVVTLSGLGMPGSQIAVLAGGLELGRTAVDDAGNWQLDVELNPGTSELVLQTRSAAGDLLAESEPISLIVASVVEPLTVNSVEQGPRGVLIPLSGTGQPGYEVAIEVNGGETAVVTIDTNGAWSAEVGAGSEPAEVSARMISPDGEVVDTVVVGQLGAVELVSPTVDFPGEQLQAGAITLTGSGQPGTTLLLLASGSELGTAVVAENGTWALETNLPAGDYDIEVATLDDAGSAVETVPALSFTVLAPEAPRFAISQLAIPEFNPLTGSLSWKGEDEPGARVALLVDEEQVNETTADADGRWRLYVNLPAGEHLLAFSRLDEAGDAVATSETVAVSLPGQLPQINLPHFSLPEELLFLVGSATQPGATGAEAAAGLPEDARDALDVVDLPAIKLPTGPIDWIGTAEPGTEVAILVDGEPVATVLAGDAGTIALTSDLAAGTYELRLGILNGDGELGGLSRPIQLDVADATVPTLAWPEDTGDGLPLTLTGTADPGATIEVAADGEGIGKTTVGEDGSWSFDLPETPGGASVRAQVLDAEGVPLLLSAPVFLSGLGESVAEAGTPSPGEATASLTGEVTYLEPIALPEGAVVTIQIQDMTVTDASADVIGQQVIETKGQQVPIAFEVAYDPDLIQENHMYGAAARIEDGAGNLLFANDTVSPVITNGNPTEGVEIVTVRVDTSVSDALLDDTTPVVTTEFESAIEAVAGAEIFSTLLEGLETAGLTETLADAEAEYTLFAPTDEAFESLPSLIVDAWDANPEEYVALLRNTAVAGKYTPGDLEDGMVLRSIGGSEIGITRDGDLIYANGIPVIDSAEAGNHYVYAVLQVILPRLAPGIEPPVIDEEGVPTFVGPLLTVVGLAEPGMRILLTVDDEEFGEIATVQPDGSWLTRENVESGIRYILAYMIDEQDLLRGLSQEVVLPVP